MDLVVIEDDQLFFPRYDLSGVIRGDLHQEYPQIEDIIAPITEALDNDTMAALNARVDVDGEEPVDVAWDFLIEEGLITED